MYILERKSLYASLIAGLERLKRFAFVCFHSYKALQNHVGHSFSALSLFFVWLILNPQLGQFLRSDVFLRKISEVLVKYNKVSSLRDV